MKYPAFYTASLAIGDCICATPTIRKISEVYNTKVVIYSHHPVIFKNLPYVKESYDIKYYITLDKSEELREKYDLHYSFWRLGQKVELSDDRGIEMKHAIIDIRQYHAIDNGFTLKKSEMQCDFIPDSYNLDFDLPKKYICLHPFKNWTSRTWDDENWKKLLKQLVNNDISVVLIGKDSIDKNIIKYLKDEVTGKTDKRVFEELEQKKVIKNNLLSDLKIYDLTNKTTLSQVWNVISNSVCVVTMDSGILHLAGTTDTNIIQLGSSIDPEYRAPYRNGSQEYKYEYVGGGCKLFCASNMKYYLRDWANGYDGGTPIQSVPLIDTCLEHKKVIDCHPKVDDVFKSILSVWNHSNNIKIENKSQHQIEQHSLVKIESNAIGDNIAAMTIIEKWRSESGKKVTVLCNFPELFRASYPNLIIHKKDDVNVEFKSSEGLWFIKDKIYTEKINTTYKFEYPLLEGYAKDFGISSEGAKLKIDSTNGKRPIKSKYVCIGFHSTAQCKYWNYPGGWDDLCKILRKKGLTPVCVEKDYSFGIKGHMNEIPNRVVKRVGLPLNEVINYIQHAEMFIGLSSGLSWIAQSLGTPTVIISNATSKDNEFVDDKTLRIYNESVCHGCFHKYKFDSGDWLWCPIYRNDEARRFICTKAITPEYVMDQIEKKYKI